MPFHKSRNIYVSFAQLQQSEYTPCARWWITSVVMMRAVPHIRRKMTHVNILFRVPRNFGNSSTNPRIMSSAPGFFIRQNTNRTTVLYHGNYHTNKYQMVSIAFTALHEALFWTKFHSIHYVYWHVVLGFWETSYRVKHHSIFCYVSEWKVYCDTYHFQNISQQIYSNVTVLFGILFGMKSCESCTPMLLRLEYVYDAWHVYDTSFCMIRI